MGIETIKTAPAFSQHVNEVSDLYERLKGELNDIFADLKPTEWNQSAISPRITQIYESVQQLRNLACKKINCE